MPSLSRSKALVTCGALVLVFAGCGVKTPLQPVNRSPVVQSLVAFPSVLAPGDSAVIVCSATDPDGEPIVFDWRTDCRLLLKDSNGGSAYNRSSNSIVVYVGTCGLTPLDTGWVNCEVRDGRGGGADAGTIRIAIQR